MKQIIKHKGLILNSKEYKENGHLLTILTLNGIETFYVKGTNKMNSGTKKYTIVPVNVEFLYAKGNSIQTFTEGYIVNNFTNLKNDQNKINTYLMIVEKVLAFGEHIDNTETFFNFVSYILELLDKTNYPNAVLALFEIKLLYLIGISPIINRCTNCEKPLETGFFNVKQAGFVCDSCVTKYGNDLSVDESTLFKYLYLIKFEKIDEAFLKLITDSKVNFGTTLDKYYEQYIDFKSKTKKILEKVS